MALNSKWGNPKPSFCRNIKKFSNERSILKIHSNLDIKIHQNLHCAEAAEAGGPAAEGGGPDEFSMDIADGLRGSRLE